MKKMQECIDWADMPENIVEMIFERLSLIDCMSVTDVCKAWRHVATNNLSGWQRHGLPWLLMSGEKDKRERTCISVLKAQEWKMLCPETCGRNCWGSYQDWLILVKFRIEIDIILFNPFTRKKIDLPKAGDFYSRMVLSGPPDRENSVCMLLDKDHQNLAFWVSGAKSWLRHMVNGEPLMDAVFSRGSFYLISKGYQIWEIKVADIFSAIKRGNVFAGYFAIDSFSRIFHQVTMSDDLENDGVVKYLVESCGELLLVCRFFSTRPRLNHSRPETNYFKVYLLDFSQMSWKRLENLGDQVLFLGKCCSRSVSSTGVGLNTSNCIYFVDDRVDISFNEWRWPAVDMHSVDGQDWGCFSLGNNIRFVGKYSWGPVWCTAPQWWCCKNSRMLKR